MNRMKNKSRLDKFLNGKGFYAVLGICMVAIGISAFVGYSAIENSNNNTAQYSSEFQSSSSNSSNTQSDTVLEQVDIPQSDIPYEEEETSSVPTESSSSPIAKYFIYPLSGDIIKDFSLSELQYSLTYNDMRLHTGIDIGADANTAVNSAGDGTVIFAGKDNKLGYTVKIDHGNGIVAIYAGLTEALKVKKGDVVAAGTNLGAVGTVTEECVDSPHLHFEILENNQPISPQTLLTNN